MEGGKRDENITVKRNGGGKRWISTKRRENCREEREGKLRHNGIRRRSSEGGLRLCAKADGAKRDKNKKIKYI